MHRRRLRRLPVIARRAAARRPPSRRRQAVRRARLRRPRGLLGPRRVRRTPERGADAGRAAPRRHRVRGAGLADVDYELELIAGRPADVIATVATTRDADEIIIGTRGFGPLRGLLGSVAHALLHQAKCPVTVIPDAALERLGRSDDVVHNDRVGG
jgi:hypothetical protein